MHTSTIIYYKHVVKDYQTHNDIKCMCVCLWVCLFLCVLDRDCNIVKVVLVAHCLFRVMTH